jgi:hypothetical protein
LATLAQLHKFRDDLREARYNGVRSVQDSNGERLEFKSDSEMAKAIAALDAEIAGASRPRQMILYPQTSKGI